VLNVSMSDNFKLNCRLGIYTICVFVTNEEQESDPIEYLAVFECQFCYWSCHWCHSW
jgi:hypothetical protein